MSGPSGSVYFAGDTGWGRHFAEIGKRFPGLRLAILPIGGFTPVWYQYEQHIGPEAALAALEELGAQTMIPMHFGTFPNGDDGEMLPVLALEAALDAHPALRRHVVVLDNGQSAVFRGTGRASSELARGSPGEAPSKSEE